MPPKLSPAKQNTDSSSTCRIVTGPVSRRVFGIKEICLSIPHAPILSFACLC